MPDRTQQPPVHDFVGFTLHSPQCFHLTNGITLKFFENQCLDLIHLSVRITAGILYEPQKRVAAFTYELLKESHPTLTSSELDDLFDYYGTTVSMVSNFGYMSLNVQVPKKNLSTIIPVVADMLSAPNYRQDNLDRYRRKSILDFEYYVKKTDYRSSQLMLNNYFGKDFAYGKILERTDIESVTMEMIESYHRLTCCAENIRLFAAGNLSDSDIHLLMNEFEKIRSGRKMPELPDAGEHFTPCRISEKWEQALQTSIVFSRPSLSYLDKDSHHYRFLTTLFCNYFGSRLMQNLRERNGCTYGVAGSTIYYSAGSLFSIESEVNNDKVDLALKESFNEMERMCNEPVSDAELDVVRNYLTGSALRSIDGTVAYMQAYTLWDDFGCDSTRFKDFVEAINAITPSDILKLSQRILQPEAFTVITIGNF